MKKGLLKTSIAAACLVSVNAFADFPDVVIDSEIVLDYGSTLDMSGAVNIPTVQNNSLLDADISINQFNHDSPVTAIANVVNNTPTGVDGQTITEVQVDVTAVGNNADIDIVDSSIVIGAVQGNQGSLHTAVGNINGNRIDLDYGSIVELNVTSVGNNLTVGAENPDYVDGIHLGTVQFNYESGSTAIGSIDGNGFGVDVAGTPAPVPPLGNDPLLNVTAVGNNLTSLAQTTGSISQINRGSAIQATGVIARNIGFIGPIGMNVTAVGNNISIK